MTTSMKLEHKLAHEKPDSSTVRYPHHLNDDVAWLLRRHRKAMGLSLENVSGPCGTSISALSRIERGKRTVGVGFLGRWADATGLQVGFVILDTPQEMAALTRLAALVPTLSGSELEALTELLDRVEARTVDAGEPPRSVAAGV